MKPYVKRLSSEIGMDQERERESESVENKLRRTELGNGCCFYCGNKMLMSASGNNTLCSHMEWPCSNHKSLLQSGKTTKSAIFPGGIPFFKVKSFRT